VGDAGAKHPGEATPPAGGDVLQWYIDKWEHPRGHSTVPLSERLRPLLPAAGRLRAKQVATRAAEPVMKSRAARLGAPGGLRLHLGSGWNHLHGWLNIDLVGAKADLVWDIRRPLPFADGSADAVFLEHVLEHMSYAEGMRVLSVARAVLRPGGTLRVGVPDAGMCARQYAEDPEALRTVRWGRPTAMMALREVFQEHGHVTAWDAETLVLVLREAGFEDVAIAEPGVSLRLDPAPDLPERWHETVYAEAVRPGLA
jgi:predicted SAM-dependent methyltransferase